MDLADTFVVLLLTYYAKYFMSLLRPSVREDITKNNTDMERLRCIKVKSVKEQKEFLDMRYPKTAGRFRWGWKSVGFIVLNLAYFVVLFRVIMWVYLRLGVNLVLWHAVLFAMVFPLLVNLLLSKFGLQKSNDIRVFFK